MFKYMKTGVIIIDNKLTTQQVVQRTKENNQFSDVVGEYINYNTKIKCLCKICNEEYYANPYDVMNGKKHRKCAVKINSNKLTKTIDCFKKELKFILPFVDVIGIIKMQKKIFYAIVINII